MCGTLSDFIIIVFINFIILHSSLLECRLLCTQTSLLTAELSSFNVDNYITSLCMYIVDYNKTLYLSYDDLWCV